VPLPAEGPAAAETRGLTEKTDLEAVAEHLEDRLPSS
jgi:hypothetical protein